MTNESNAPCRGGPYDIAAPFVGTWHEFTVSADGDEELEGTLVTTLEVDGCALTQRFESIDGTFSFLSFAYVEASTGCWLETYVFNNGRSTQWRWVPRDGELFMERMGDHPTRRLRIVNHTEAAYEVIEEKRERPKEEWEFVVLTRTRRAE